MWVRGLKLAYPFPAAQIKDVAPYVGAWIETHTEVRQSLNIVVAPYVGAWIETISVGLRLGAERGRTLCGCVD